MTRFLPPIEIAEQAELAYADPVITVGALGVRAVVRNGVAVLAFRGTANLSNWILDAHDELVQVTEAGQTFRMEAGFKEGSDQLLEPVGNFMVQCTGMPVWVTGHSLGCPLGVRVAAWLKEQGFNIVGGLWLESPQFSDAAGAAYFASKGYANRFIRHAADLVPNVPGTGKGYVFPGAPDETLILDDNGIELDRQPLPPEWNFIEDIEDTKRDHDVGAVLRAYRLFLGRQT